MAWAHLTVTQHVLIKMIFGIFAVSCTVHVNFITFLPHLKLNSAANYITGLSRPIIEVLTKHSTPEIIFYFEFLRKKRKKE